MPLLAAVRAAGQRLTCAGGQEASCDVTALQIHSGDLAASVFLYIFLYSVSSLFTCHNLAWGANDETCPGLLHHHHHLSGQNQINCKYLCIFNFNVFFIFQ